MNIDDLYLELMEKSDREDQICEADFLKFQAKVVRMMNAAIGRKIKVRANKHRDHGNASRIFYSGTIENVEPGYVRATKSAATVYWKVTLHTGRVVNISKI